LLSGTDNIIRGFSCARVSAAQALEVNNDRSESSGDRRASCRRCFSGLGTKRPAIRWPTRRSRAPPRSTPRIGTTRTRRQSGAQNRGVSGCSNGHRVRNWHGDETSCRDPAPQKDVPVGKSRAGSLTGVLSNRAAGKGTMRLRSGKNRLPTGNVLSRFRQCVYAITRTGGRATSRLRGLKESRNDSGLFFPS